MFTHYQTKLIRPPAPGTPVAVCPTCGVRGHLIVAQGRQVVAGCKCHRTRPPEPNPSEGANA